MIPRFLVTQDVPLSKYKRNDIIFPTKKELVEVKKYPNFFSDKTIRYEIVETENNQILKVKCLVTKTIYSIGDLVIYKLSHVDYHCAFYISGFKETDNYKAFITVCWDSKEYKDSMAKACGLSLCRPLVDVSLYDKIEYLK